MECFHVHVGGSLGGFRLAPETRGAPALRNARVCEPEGRFSVVTHLLGE